MTKPNKSNKPKNAAPAKKQAQAVASAPANADEPKLLIVDAAFREAILAGRKTRTLKTTSDIATHDTVIIACDMGDGKVEPLVLTKVSDVHGLTITQFGITIIPDDSDRQPYAVSNLDGFAALDGFQNFASMKAYMAASGTNEIEDARGIVWSPAFIEILTGQAQIDAPAPAPEPEKPQPQPPVLNELATLLPETDPTEEQLSKLCEVLGGVEFEIEPDAEADKPSIMIVFNAEDAEIARGTYVELRQKAIDADSQSKESGN